MSRFKGVFDARQTITEDASEPEPETKATKVAKVTKVKPKAVQASAPAPEPVSDKPKLGRPPGKRSNPEYQSVTTFLHRETYLAVQRELVGTDKDFGDVVDELLKSWLKQNQ
jgi:hypothetical protein